VTLPASISSSTTTTTIYTSTCPAATVPTPGSQLYPLRIEGKDSTIFEGLVSSTFGIVTTPSGGTHECDGTNDGANPTPGNTATNSLSHAAQDCGFSFDGTFDSQFDDYFITSIGDSTQTSTQFWGLLDNFQFTPTGGCQSEASTTREILWAFDAFNAQYFLKLSTSATTVPVGGSIVATVVDGMSGSVIAGALVSTGTTDASGHVTLTFPHAGAFVIKASRSGAIRSNGVLITVTS
jgi:hypothetical protein